MWENIKSFLAKLFDSRIVFLILAFLAMSSVLIVRLFSMQIVHGEDAQSNYELLVIKEKNLKSTRGCIYDRNGKLLAYNELAYVITIEDNGSYSKNSERHETINSTIKQVLDVLDKYNDKAYNDFFIDLDAYGNYTFNVEGSKLKRALADVYGLSSTSDLGYSKELGYSTANATPDQVMDYLYNHSFYIPKDYSEKDKYRIAVVRYNMSENTFQRYISTVIASDVSEETVAYISEHEYELQGVKVAEDTIRKYNSSKYFAHIIGYTGQIDTDEYASFSALSDEYSLTDTVGKSGIEQYMDKELKGKKGYEKLYVDNLGKELENLERVEPQAGNDVYLSIDKDLQEAVYALLEQEIAGIVYSKIINEKTYDSKGSSDVKIPIDDVYYALINNSVIDTRHFSTEQASDTEKKVQKDFEENQKKCIKKVSDALKSSSPIPFGQLSTEMQVYENYVQTMLTNDGIIDNSKIDWNNPGYIAWKNDEISLQEYLKLIISNGWFDITKLGLESEYSDTDELYESLVNYVIEKLQDDLGFSKKIYKFMIADNKVTGRDICLILFDQMIIDYDDEKIAKIKNGTISPFEFIMNCIKNLEITPAQLALDPCTGSCVITDVETGELLACVTYPGYDNNKLANKVDSEYFASLLSDLSSPFYNNATQQKTAPGSTFKMITATAGLTEEIIDTSTLIEDRGVFDTVANGPKCWYYPGSHGEINVSEALRDSCNYFFYETAWRLSQKDGSYDENTGMTRLQKYAALFGLDDTTGIEISESSPEIATQYPVTTAIGQSDNNYTTIGLARYVTAVANRGTIYNYTLLSKLTDSRGNLIKTYSPTVKYTMDEISDSTWDAIQYGNMLVCANNSAFKNFPEEVVVAGKTGTAQQTATRPNHALFVGYAPYEKPTVSIATRIAYGYTSKNAAMVSAEILKYYFDLESETDIITGQAANVDNVSNTFND